MKHLFGFALLLGVLGFVSCDKNDAGNLTFSAQNLYQTAWHGTWTAGSSSEEVGIRFETMDQGEITYPDRNYPGYTNLDRFSYEIKDRYIYFSFGSAVELDEGPWSLVKYTGNRLELRCGVEYVDPDMHEELILNRVD